ncbi:hypothetical protein FCG67_09510 [Rhodococcus oryzae]|uniref:Uncharacterized protein n=1 Tax=Rhodococcus oryzae TaxID=2571143 RepID=A0ABY2RKK2_9NOCA|nr:hypothetical protein FCG67_09510 [Rhodococcus oryzae]
MAIATHTPRVRLEWQHNLASASLRGVGRDARHPVRRFSSNYVAVSVGDSSAVGDSAALPTTASG